MSRLVRFFRPASWRRLPSYAVRGHASSPLSRANPASSSSVEVAGAYQSRTVAQTSYLQACVGELGQLDPSGDDAVLDVVDGVGDVVGQVHDLRLDAGLADRRGRAHPVERRTVVVVHAELPDRPWQAVGVATGGNRRLVDRPRVLRGGVEHAAGQVEAEAAAVGVERLGLQPGEQPERLRVALEATDVRGQLGQRALAVVPERRVAEVVREAGRLDQVGVAADGHGDVASDLGDLEGVGEAVAGEVVGRRADHLGLGGQATQCRGVHDAGPVTLERRTSRVARLGEDTLDVGLVVRRR